MLSYGSVQYCVAMHARSVHAPSINTVLFLPNKYSPNNPLKHGVYYITTCFNTKKKPEYRAQSVLMRLAKSEG
jgi:hypothetical protein